jgi:hypothetical protein
MSDVLLEPADTQQTDDRLAIRKLYTSRRISPDDFDCKYMDECCQEPPKCYKGIWPYVGAEYGRATIAGQSARILFVGMEQGGRDQSDLRTFPEQQQDFRTGAEKRRSRHMAGVASVMEQLVDEKTPARYSLQFALTNAVKCTKETGSSTSSSTTTPIMIKNCASHLAAEIVELKPDLLVVQGGHPRRTVRRLCGLSSEPSCPSETYRARYRDHEFVVLATYHGAARGPKPWPNKVPAAWEPAVRGACDELLALLQRGSPEA